MIEVGWSECGLQQAFQLKFWSMAMDVNIKMPLFEVKTKKTKPNSAEKEEEVHTAQTIEFVMEDSLTRITKIATSNKKTTISILKSMARKRPESIQIKHFH